MNWISCIAGFCVLLAFSGENFIIASSENADFYEFECSSDAAEKRNMFTAKYKNTIGIQVSHRATHQLSSRIFAIFLREKLGYQNVKLVDFHVDKIEEDYKLYRTLDALSAPAASWPIPTIDLEVWMHPDYHAVTSQISEAGLVTDPGRFGWFVPAEFVQSYRFDLKLETLHYTTFLNLNSTHYSKFLMDDRVLNQIRERFNIQREYEPPQCRQRQCAVLLSEFYNDTAFVENHINEFNFYVKVYWLGDNLINAIDWLLSTFRNQSRYFQRQKLFMVLHWTPSLAIDSGIPFEAITLPKCENIISSSDTLCKYEMTPLLKYYARGFLSASHGFSALQYFYIPKHEMTSLLTASREAIKSFTGSMTSFSDFKNQIYDTVACKWLQDNENISAGWMVTEPVEITIGGIFPITGTGSTISAYSGIVPAVKMAVNAINNNLSILPNYNLTVLVHNGECRSDIVMKTFIQYFNLVKPLAGVLGPACSETVEPIAGISKHTRMAVISYSAEGASFNDRDAYPFFFRTIGSNRQYETVYLNLFERLEWRRVAALTEDGQKYTEYISHMETLLKQNNMELITNQKFPRDISAMEMRRILLDLKNKNAQIIIADIYNDVAQMVMCEAFHLKMTAYNGYVWFLPAWLAKTWIRDSIFNKKENMSCSPEELFEAINGHLSLAHSPFGNKSVPMQENKSIDEWLNDFKQHNSDVSDYTGFAYDAVWVYAKALDKLLREEPTAINDLRSPNTVNRFVDLIWATDFEGLSGRIRFGEGGSRVNDIDVLQWIDKSFHEVGKYLPTFDQETLKIIGGELDLDESSIKWLWDKGRPNDGMFVCAMATMAEFLNTDCENVTIILTTLCCFILVVIVSLASFMFWKRRYDKKLKQSAKVMRNFGIDLLSPSGMMINTLDKWEIPKDKVVINRRLGEGAFGTVYGGEAQINNNEGWTAVAVKTLKVGATTEDRLDFLSEAEAMKRLDHKNVVKLLGVCLQTEPIYTIMEFMLYGDLKTYLLARRHLVTEKLTDDSDISPKRLTMMSLDVARGLSYLAEQKYVHRDIACRNCLVNAHRVVKLGDFGMARPMFENDYYRFNRKGMLPVRWMAPESLALGVFTPSSDVWSFGILLYEIITFGSFPYQGLTNNEVLEYIKSGKSLQIPTGTKPHLENLIKACWYQEYKIRPSASEIVEYISNYPRLLTPCLDVPLSSVQMPETESDQMELLPRSHRRPNAQQNLDILARASNINNFDQTEYSRRIANGSFVDGPFGMSNLNVPPDSVSNDENTVNSYSQMEPLLQPNHEISDNNLNLSRYVPMDRSSRQNKNVARDSQQDAADCLIQGTTDL